MFHSLSAGGPLPPGYRPSSAWQSQPPAVMEGRGWEALESAITQLNTHTAFSACVPTHPTPPTLLVDCERCPNVGCYLSVCVATLIVYPQAPTTAVTVHVCLIQYANKCPPTDQIFIMYCLLKLNTHYLVSRVMGLDY